MTPQKQYSKMSRGIESAREFESPVKIMDKQEQQKVICESFRGLMIKEGELELIDQWVKEEHKPLKQYYDPSATKLS